MSKTKNIKRIYIGGSFFHHKEEVRSVAEVLKSRGYELYIPMDFHIPDAWSFPNAVWARKVFDADMDALNCCDLMVMLCYDNKDGAGGTPWEAGYCYGRNIPYIAVHLEQSKQTSLMIANGATVNVNTVAELLELDFDNLTACECTVDQT